MVFMGWKLDMTNILINQLDMIDGCVWNIMGEYGIFLTNFITMVYTPQSWLFFK